MELPPGWRRAGPFRSNAGYRPALARARDEAAILYHRQIRPSHILAGLLHSPDARVVAVFDDLGIRLSDIAVRLALTIGRPLPPHDGGPDLPYTPRGVAVLGGAVLAAEQMRHDWLGAVHLLAALTLERWGAAPRVLHGLSAGPERLWPAIERVAEYLAPPPSTDAPLIIPILADPL
jgi:ATP-dependent Clp protease ATP-binding subunit ClpA